MKKIFFAAILFLSVVCVKAQKVLDIPDITVNGVALLNQNKSLLIQHFGEPISIDVAEKEGNLDDYYYDGISFRVNKNGIIKVIEINKSNYAFTSFNIHVGDDIQEVEKKIKLSAEVGTDGETPDNHFVCDCPSLSLDFKTENNQKILNITVHL